MAKIVGQGIEPGRAAGVGGGRGEGGCEILALELAHTHAIDIVEAIASRFDIEQERYEQHREQQNALVRGWCRERH